MRTKGHEEVLDLKELFEKQAALDSTIMAKHGVTHEQVMPNLIRALKTELGEAVAKWGGFKYWSKKQKYSRDEILEECIDILHFYLSIGNFLEVPTEHHYMDCKKGILNHLDALEYSLLIVHEPIGWYMSFSLFRGLLESWGFEWENDVLRMYDIKNKINYQRQEEGY